jgi:hypothetical protein
MDYVSAHWQIIALIVAVIILLVSYRAVLALCGVILVPDDGVGGGAAGGTLVDVLLANVIRDGTLRSVPKT